MAAINLYLNDALANSWQQLTESTVAAATTCGWIVGTGTTNRSKFASGTGVTSERAASTFDATTYPNGTIDATLHDCWRSQNTYNGNFVSANWTVTGAVRAVTNNGGTETGVLHVRLFKSPNADGSGATQITSAIQSSSTSGAISTGSDTNVTVTFNPGAFVCNNEYLFFQIAWGRVGAGGMTSSDCHFRTGSAAGTGTRIATSDFVPKAALSSLGSRAFGRAIAATLLSVLALTGVSKSIERLPGAEVGGLITPVALEGQSRDGSRALATGINLVSYATPLRAVARLPGAALSVTEQAGAAPIRTSGRLLASGINLVSYATPARAVARAPGASLDLLQGGTYEGVSRAIPRLIGSLGVGGGETVELAGYSRASSRALSSSINLVAYATPSREISRVRGASLSLFYPTQSARAFGRLLGADLQTTEGGTAELAGQSRSLVRLLGAQLVQSLPLQGQSRDVARVQGATVGAKAQLAGTSRGVQRLVGALLVQSLALEGQSRNIERLQAAMLAGKVSLAGQSRGLERLRPGLLAGKVSLAGRSIGSLPRAYAGLGFAGGATVELSGYSRDITRARGAELHITLGAKPARSIERLLGAQLVSHTALSGKSLAGARLIGSLGFTGATVVQLAGDSRDIGRLKAATLRAYNAGSPIRALARLRGASLTTKVALLGQCRSLARAYGAFRNPYERSTIRGFGRLLGGQLDSQLVLEGFSREIGRLREGNLIIPAQEPRYVFVAKQREFILQSQARHFVFEAKSRRYLFLA